MSGCPPRATAHEQVSRRTQRAGWGPNAFVFGSPAYGMWGMGVERHTHTHTGRGGGGHPLLRGRHADGPPLRIIWTSQSEPLCSGGGVSVIPVIRSARHTCGLSLRLRPVLGIVETDGLGTPYGACLQLLWNCSESQHDQWLFQPTYVQPAPQWPQVHTFAVHPLCPASCSSIHRRCQKPVWLWLQTVDANSCWWQHDQCPLLPVKPQAMPCALPSAEEHPVELPAVAGCQLPKCALPCSPPGLYKRRSTALSPAEKVCPPSDLLPWSILACRHLSSACLSGLNSISGGMHS